MMDIPSLELDSTHQKCLKIMFVIIHIYLSMDFGFVKFSNCKVAFVIKLLTLGQCLCIITIYFIESADIIKNMLTPFRRFMVVFLAICVSIQYLANTLALVLNGHKKSLCRFLETLQAIDSKLFVDSQSHNMETKIILICLLCETYKAVINNVFCHSNVDECLIFSSGFTEIWFLIMLMSFDIILIMYAFVFYSVYCRMKVFNKFVYMSDATQVLECLDIYTNIADSLQVLKKYFDILYILALAIVTPDQVYTIYLGLLKLKLRERAERNTLIYILRNLYTIYNFILLVSPAIAAGLVTITAEELKLILLERILRERNMNHEPHLQMFADYVSARPLRFAVLKVVPLDWSLPILMLNLIITYQIIIVQFTQLY